MEFKHIESSLEKKKEYPKLIRDEIPEIIKANNGIEIKTQTLEDDAEYLKFLLKKVTEEAHELANAESKEHLIEEIADVMEVIDTILDVNKVDRETVKKAQEEKRNKRGGFKKRLLMLEKA